MEEVSASHDNLSIRVSGWLNAAAVWTLILILAWAPFPLGSNREWSWSLLFLLVSLCWLLWWASRWNAIDNLWSQLRYVLGPVLLVGLVLIWATIQALPVMPKDWAHPLWSMNNDLLGTTNGGTISLNPWRTITEIMKLSGYAAIAWMTYSLSRRPENARKLFNAVIAIGGFYAFYAFVLAISNTSQLEIFGYPPPSLKRITGPFVLHNSFATYCGLAAIAAGLKLVEKGAGAVVADRGWRKLSLTLMQFLFGKGLPVFCAFVLLFSAVIASASRAGTVSLLCGLIAVSLLSLAVGRGKIARGWGSLAVFAALTPILIMLLFGGEQLGNRFASLLSDGQADEIRLALWAACQRMIEFAPWLGLGLGTFQDSYPLYAEKVFPFVMDKAHSDYLELAAGLGLPAAIAWWGALIWLAARCLRGVFVRRRDRIYAAAAVGASVLVAVHSSVDFSLQIPAVAISFAVILGIGVAQSIPTRKV